MMEKKMEELLIKIERLIELRKKEEKLYRDIYVSVLQKNVPTGKAFLIIEPKEYLMNYTCTYRNGPFSVKQGIINQLYKEFKYILVIEDQGFVRGINGMDFGNKRIVSKGK